jgi:hypothetical protein
MNWETERQISRAASSLEKKDGALEQSVAACQIERCGGTVMAWEPMVGTSEIGRLRVCSPVRTTSSKMAANVKQWQDRDENLNIITSMKISLGNPL